MERLVRSAHKLLEFCSARDWAACVIGGLAVQAWGEPRLTRDVDLSLLTGFGNEQIFVRALLDRYDTRIDDAEAFALENRVLLLLDNDLPLDICLAAIPFEQRVFQRSRAFEFLPGISLRICSAEDLLVYKTFANRPRDWVDVEGVLVRQKGKLDLRLVESELEPLVEAKEQPDILLRFKEMAARTP
ncbi:MAG TPA: hypothetical protein VE641_02845 [Chthoniobacterales bacterium]|nr:hypothetical protein [Chthoniobacterales bacterium]